MLTCVEYQTERAICDRAHAYAESVMRQNGPKRIRNYLTAEECMHPDYAACNNEMRGRVEQYEILSDPPAQLSAYVSSTGEHVTTWTGDILGRCTLGRGWRVHSYVGSRMYQATAWINGREYTGRTFGSGMFVNLRETAASKRRRMS